MSAAAAVCSSVTSGFDDAYENGAMAAKKLTGELKYWDRIERTSVGLILYYRQHSGMTFVKNNEAVGLGLGRSLKFV